MAMAESINLRQVPWYSSQIEVDFSNLLDTINHKLDKHHKKLAPFLLQHILTTGNSNILKHEDIVRVGEEVYKTNLENARDKITAILSEYKIYDRLILVTDIQNIFQISKKEIEKILKGMEKRGVIRLLEDRIELA